MQEDRRLLLTSLGDADLNHLLGVPVEEVPQQVVLGVVVDGHQAADGVVDVLGVLHWCRERGESGTATSIVLPALSYKAELRRD